MRFFSTWSCGCWHNDCGMLMMTATGMRKTLTIITLFHAGAMCPSWLCSGLWHLIYSASIPLPWPPYCHDYRSMMILVETVFTTVTVAQAVSGPTACTMQDICVEILLIWELCKQQNYGRHAANSNHGDVVAAAAAAVAFFVGVIRAAVLVPDYDVVVAFMLFVFGLLCCFLFHSCSSSVLAFCLFFSSSCCLLLPASFRFSVSSPTPWS